MQVSRPLAAVSMGESILTENTVKGGAENPRLNQESVRDEVGVDKEIIKIRYICSPESD